MQLGDIANADAAPNGKPLDGVRVLAAEQMQALPFATQLLARLGAEVVKVEHPALGGVGARGAAPSMKDPQGRTVGATFLRNNLNKRSVGLDLKHPAGKELFIELAGRFDVVGENFKAGTMDRLGLGYEVLAARWPELVYVSVSGFGNLGDSPYRTWPAYAMVPEAMSGLYEYSRLGDEPPRVIPAGALGDISSALFAVIGVQAALRHRERTGRGQMVDIAMLDAMLAMGDVVTNFWSLGERSSVPEVIVGSFRAADGWFAVQVAREHQFEALAELVGRHEWLTDERLATRRGWADHIEDVVRPAVEAWAAGHDPHRGVRRARRGQHPLGAVLHGAGGDRGRARRPAQHARGDAPARRRGRPGADPGQPGEAVRGGRGARDPGSLGRRAHRRGAGRRARPLRGRLRRACGPRASSPDPRPSPPRPPGPRPPATPHSPAPPFCSCWITVLVIQHEQNGVGAAASSVGELGDPGEEPVAHRLALLPGPVPGHPPPQP